MPRNDINHLLAFLAVARERSFTRAAAPARVSQSALSHTIRDWRAARDAAADPQPRAAWRRPRPANAWSGPWGRDSRRSTPNFRADRAAGKARGTIRITAGEHSAETILWPALPTAAALSRHQVEIVIDYGLTDIVAERYDAGVRSANRSPGT